MKAKLCLFLVFIISTISVNSQNADIRIGELLNKSDWFALDEEYPKLKDSIQTPMLKWMAEALLANNFNQPEKALVAIDTLLNNYQETLGLNNSMNVLLMASVILDEMGLYEKSTKRLEDFFDKMAPYKKKEDLPSHSAFYDMIVKMKNEKASDVFHPYKDIEIPFTIEKAGKGSLMFVPVEVNGKMYKFIFDSGAGVNFISEQMAKELGVKITNNKFPMFGVTKAYGKQGVLESMKIGDITYKNAVFGIAPPIEATDTIFKVDAVLGIDFMKQMGEIQIYPKEKKIIFPLKQTKLPSTGRNITLSNRMVILKTFYKNDKLMVHFDSGNASGGFYYNFFEKNKEWIEAICEPEIIRVGGFGGISTSKGYVIKDIKMKVGNTVFNIEKSTVNAEKDESQDKLDGVLGMDFIQTFSKIIINLDKMFIEVEK